MTMLNFLKGKLLHIPAATLKINVEIKVRTRQFSLWAGWFTRSKWKIQRNQFDVSGRL